MQQKNFTKTGATSVEKIEEKKTTTGGIIKPRNVGKGGIRLIQREMGKEGQKLIGLRKTW